MKKLMKSLMLFAAAAMALTSCENEAMNEGIEANETFTLSFTAGAPESKTSVAIDGNNATFSWSKTGEKLYFLQYGGGKIYKNQSEEGVIEGDKATFSVEFTSQVEGVTTYTYSAIYPSTSFVNENDDWNGVEVKIPEMQVFVENSYDPAADLMVAQPIEADYNDTKIHNLKFTRLAAVAKMNVKNITADEVIQTIEFALAEGTKFVGEEASVDVENSVLVEGGNKNSITLVPANELTTTGEAISVFFTCFPIEYTGDYTLTVETDKATYSNTGTITTPLTFTAGNVMNFNIKAGERTEKSENVASWYKINSLSELAVGDKVALVGTTGSGSYSMTGGNSSTAPTVSKVTFNADGTLASVVGLTTFNIGKDGSNYILYAGEDTTSWLYCTDTNNGVRVGANSNKVWTIASHTNNGSDFEFKHNGTNRYLGIYSNNNWRCYTTVNAGNFTNTTGTSDIAIYKYGMSGDTPVDPEEPVQLEAPEVDATASGNSVTLTWDEVANASSYTVTYGTTTIENATSPCVISDLAYSTTYKFSVVAVGDGTNYTNSAAGTVTAKTEADPNISDGGVVVLSEEFDNNTTSDSSSAISKTKFANFSGATEKAYTSKYGGIKLGASSSLGYITSKSLDLSSAFTVQIDACKYSSDTGNIVVTVGNQTKTIKNSELKAAGTFTTYTLEFEAEAATSTIKIATSAKRAYIDNVIVTVHN